MRAVLVIVIVLFLLEELAAAIVVDLFWSIYNKEALRLGRADPEKLRVALSSIRASVWISAACEVTAIPVIAYLDRAQSNPLAILLGIPALLALNGMVLFRVWEKRKLVDEQHP